MLRSNRCVLSDKSPEQMAQLLECPLDPGGYFIVKGTEKVILIQEQLSKNRIIVENDRKGFIQASVSSSTSEKKTKTYVVSDKFGKIFLRHNSLSADIPIVVAMRAMGIPSDREISELVCGDDQELLNILLPSLEDGVASPAKSQLQALEYMGGKVKFNMKGGFRPMAKRNLTEEAKELLQSIALAHVPVEEVNGDFNFRPKAIYVAVMIRRVLVAIKDGGTVDDRDFIGNKRLEL